MRRSTELKRKRDQRRSMTQIQRVQDAIQWLPKWAASNKGETHETMVRAYRERYGLSFYDKVGNKEAKAIAVMVSGEPMDDFGIRSAERVWTEIIMDVYPDNQFAFIAGYTPGGMPFGIRYDELD